MFREIKYKHRFDEQKEKIEKLVEELKTFRQKEAGGKPTDENCGSSQFANVSNQKLDELKNELEEQRDLAASRLLELQELSEKNKELKKEVDHLRVCLKFLTPDAIFSSTEYKCLQSQFTLLCAESLAIRKQFEEVKDLLSTVKNSHAKQIEQIEVK